MRKATKQEAHYGNGMKSAHCGICTHYLGNGRCEKVQGIVSPNAWCKYFKSKGRFTANEKLAAP